MAMTVQKFYHCIYNAIRDTIGHDGVEHAGYLAFLGLLSFFPFLVLFVAIGGMLGQSQVGNEFVTVLLSIMPDHITGALRPRVEEIVGGPPQGLVTVAIVGIIWTASSAVEGARTILNRAYRVSTPPSYILRRLMSVVQMLLLTMAMMLVMLLFIFAPVFWQHLGVWFGIAEAPAAWTYIRYGLSGFVALWIVAVSYYILPNIRQTWHAVLPGATLVVVLWLGAAGLFSAYLRNFEQVNLVYGSLGGIIATLLFFYVLGVLYIFGAEFNYYYDKAIGLKLEEREKVKKKRKAVKAALKKR